MDKRGPDVQRCTIITVRVTVGMSMIVGVSVVTVRVPMTM